MAEPTNEERAERAYRAVHAHYTGYPLGSEDIETGITDLATDLLHLADQYGMDQEQLQARAMRHYRSEQFSDGPSTGAQC